MREHDGIDEALQNAQNQWLHRNETVTRQECMLLIKDGRLLLTDIQIKLIKTMPAVIL